MKYVAINIHGNYLSLSGGFSDIGGAVAASLGGRLRADGTGIGDPSIFERVERGGSQLSLRMLDGSWLGLAGDMLARVEEPAATTFTEVWWPDDRISLKADNGRFVCAENGGGREVVVNRSEAGDWEKFHYEQVPAELLPAAETEQGTAAAGVSSSVADALREQAQRSRLDNDVPDLTVIEQSSRSESISEGRRPFP